MRLNQLLIFLLLLIISLPMNVTAEEKTSALPKASDVVTPYSIFDDKMLLEGYSKKYAELPKEILLAMVKDETLSSYQTAAAVRIFKEEFSSELVSKEKKHIEKLLLKRLNRSESPFIQVEIMDTLCRMDRYRYFKPMVPVLIQKLGHYNETVNEMAFNGLINITKNNGHRAREARLVFNTLRKIFFLSRNRLAEVKTPSPKLARQLKIMRWSIKVLGSQQLKKLPKEVINLL